MNTYRITYRTSPVQTASVLVWAANIERVLTGADASEFYTDNGIDPKSIESIVLVP